MHCKTLLAALLLVVLPGLPLTAQTKPDFFPEDVNPDQLALRCFCQPGVRFKSRSRGLELSYALSGPSTFEPEKGEFSEPYSSFDRLSHFIFKLRVPVINRDAIKLLIGYNYEKEAYRFGQIGTDFQDVFEDLDGHSLRSNSFSVILTKPFGETAYLAGRFRYSANGDYPTIMDFGKEYSIYNALLSLGFKRTEDFEWGFGIWYSQSFRRASPLPFVFYNRNFNHRWGVEAVIPAYIFVRFNLSDKDILLTGFEYDSQSYRIAIDRSPLTDYDYAINHSEMVLNLKWERWLAPWIWLDLQAGYQLNFSTDFEAKSLETPSFEVEPTPSPLFKVGVFLSPPGE